MKLEKLLENVDIVSLHADNQTLISGVSYDTRVIRGGELFVAIKGYQTDGHDYIGNAVNNGAVCVICEKVPNVDIPYVLVNDSRRALSMVSSTWYNYPARKLKIVGVTGTNGKTSVTNLIKRILEKSTGKKVGLIGTNGNYIGDRELPSEHTTPESFEMQKLLDKMVLENCKYVVMEVSSHALYLCRVSGIEYDVAVFTNLTPEHLDFHGTMDRYAAAKAILFQNCREAVINIDDKYAGVMTANTDYPILTYAINDTTADIIGKDIKLKADRVEFTSKYKGDENNIKLLIPGMFSVYNALAAIGATTLLGIDIQDAASALLAYEGVKGRAEVIAAGQDYTVLIDYAHTPDALENIITTARGFTKGKVITLFGCGGDRDKGKRPQMGKIATNLSNFSVITSDNPRTETPADIINEIVSGVEKERSNNYIVIENRRDAINYALNNMQKDDTLIIAGKGHETYQILGSEKVHFDDREVVAEYIKGLRVEQRKLNVKPME